MPQPSFGSSTNVKGTGPSTGSSVVRPGGSNSKYAQMLRRVFNPQVILFGAVVTPIIFLAQQLKPVKEEEMIKDFRERYGFQYERDVHAKNARIMESIYNNRHAGFSQRAKQPPFSVTNNENNADNQQQINKQ